MIGSASLLAWLPRFSGACAGVALAVMVAGCSSVRPGGISTDLGEPMEQDVAEAIARDWLEARLKDPYSAKISFEPINEGWARHVARGVSAPGYILVAKVNAKNSFGAYTWTSEYISVFRYNSLTQVVQP